MSEAKLLVPDREKNREWIISHLKYIDSLCNTNAAGEKKVDIKCWRYFHNDIDMKEFDYLTMVGQNHLPTKMRHIPLQRKYCDLLISTQTKRNLIYSMFLTDKNSIKEKAIEMNKNIVSDMIATVIGKQKDYEFQMQMMDMQMQQMQEQFQQMQQQTQQAQEQGQQVDQGQMIQMKMQMMKAESDMSKVRETMSLGIEMNNDELKELKKRHKYTIKDWKDELAQKVAIKIFKETSLKNKSLQNFVQDVAIGKQAYFVNTERGYKYPIIDALNCLDVYYPAVEGITEIQKMQWVAISQRWSSEQLINKLGKEFVKEYGEDKLNDICKNYTTSRNQMMSGPNGEAYFEDAVYSGSSSGAGIEVTKVYFKVPRIIYVKRSPNKHEEGKNFIKFVDSSKIMLDEEEYKYSNGEYINRKDSAIKYGKDEVVTYNKKKGQDYIDMYMTDIYQGIIVNDEYYLSSKKMDFPLRDPDDWSMAYLPVFGPAFNAITNRPHSLIKSTMNLQDIYNIIYMQRDLMLALAGTKTIIYDRAQKPSELTDEEQEYNRKMGKFEIETTSPDGRKINSSYNQFTQVDMSVSASIQYLEMMLEKIDYTMGNLIGISQQALGNIVSTDQVGTAEMSLRQSQLLTETRFYNHDIHQASALEAAVNLYLSYHINDDTLLDIYDDDNNLDIVSIQKGIFKDRKVSCKIFNTSEDETKKRKIEELAMMGHKEGLIPFQNVVELLTTTSVTEIKNKVDYFAEEAEKLRQAQAQQAGSQQMDVESQKIKLQQEFEGYWKQQEMSLSQQTEQMNMQLAKANLDIQAQQLELNKAKQASDSQLKLMELMNEDKTEMAYLGEQKRSKIVDEQLRQAQLQIQAIMNTMQVKQSKEDSDKKHIEGLKKIKVDESKAKGTAPKEQISDR